MQFSLNRFYNLFIKQWKENKRAYILAAFSLPILMFVTCLITAYTSNLTENNQDAILGFGMIILGGIFSSTLLSEYNPKPKGIRSLILPTSAIEKLLVAIVYGLIIFPIAYIILVCPIILLANYIDFEIFGNLNMLATTNIKSFLSISLVAISTSSFVLLCSLIYKKFIFIKAALTLISFIFILFLSNNLLNSVLIGNSQPISFTKEYLKYLKIPKKEAKNFNFELEKSAPFNGLHFNAGTLGPTYISTSEAIGKMGFIVFTLICPVMLTACFYRLKETEL